MKKENIIVIEKANNWEEAIRVSGDLLVKASSCTNDYVEAMIEAVNNLGAYIVIAPNIALAHARPSNSVKKNDISLAVFKEPISFGHESNDPVSLVFSFCATESQGHLEQLGKLASNFDTDTIEAIKNSNTINDIFNILNK